MSVKKIREYVKKHERAMEVETATITPKNNKNWPVNVNKKDDIDRDYLVGDTIKVNGEPAEILKLCDDYTEIKLANGEIHKISLKLKSLQSLSFSVCKAD